jgi:hypothetical protein
VTGALLDRPAAIAERSVPGGRVTLEERLDAILRAVRTNGSSECPLCHAQMAPAPGGAPGAERAAQCAGCNTRLG